MRIAHVTATFPPYRGGTGNVCDHHTRELARRGHEVHIFTAAVAGAPDEELRYGVVIHRLQPLLRVGNAPVLLALLHQLKHFDLIHLHFPFFGGEITAVIAWLRRMPLVITYHQDVLLDGLLGVIERVQRPTVGRFALRSASRVLFTSQDYGRASWARALLRGREHVIDALPNGVDTRIFHPGEAPVDLRARHRLEPSDQVALLVAALDRAHYFKGVEVFLQALAQLPSAVKGVIVGDGELREHYAAVAHRAGLGGRVAFAGRVRQADLPCYYRLADVTVLPSTTMGEAFGLVLVESLASGTPVIASNLPGVRTVVTMGAQGDGILVEPRNPTALAAALREILSDEHTRRVMGQRGRAKVETGYDWAHIGVQLEQIYQQVLAERAIYAPIDIR